MSTESESFLTRWSRRKREAERKVEPPSETAAPPPPAVSPAKAGDGDVAAIGPALATAQPSEPASTTEAPLPPIDSLDGVRSDYQAFFQQPVSEDLRRAALKKLFADPHFNHMDMLDVYVDDYTQFEPLSAAMRMRMPSARDFLLDSERAALDAAEATPGTAPGVVADTAQASGDAPTGSASAPDAESAEAASASSLARGIDANAAAAAPRGKVSPDSTST